MGAILAASLAFGPPAFADELGREVEAPTVFTGENVLVRTGIPIIRTQLPRSSSPS